MTDGQTDRQTDGGTAEPVLALALSNEPPQRRRMAPITVRKAQLSAAGERVVRQMTDSSHCQSHRTALLVVKIVRLPLFKDSVDDMPIACSLSGSVPEC